MSEEKPSTENSSPEQLIFAKVLAKATRIGLVILLLTYGVYLSGLLTPAVPMDRLPSLWGLPSQEYGEIVNQEYLHLEHAPCGWDWLKLAGQGDFISFAGIACMALVTLACFLAIIPSLLRRKDTAYLVIAVLEVAILVLAASGVLTSSH